MKETATKRGKRGENPMTAKKGELATAVRNTFATGEHTDYLRKLVPRAKKKV